MIELERNQQAHNNIDHHTVSGSGDTLPDNAMRRVAAHIGARPHQEIVPYERFKYIWGKWSMAGDRTRLALCYAGTLC
jgi:hypothetical protein